MAARKRKRGITRYDHAVASAVCAHIGQGGTLRSWCRDHPRPDRRTLQRWLELEPRFERMWSIARRLQLDEWGDEIIEVANDGRNDTYLDDKGSVVTAFDVINRSRLRVDTMKWFLARRHPEYSDKVEVGGAGGGPLVIRWDDGPRTNRAD